MGNVRGSLTAQFLGLPLLQAVRRRRARRQFREEDRARLRREAQKENARLFASFQRHPLALIGLAVTDLYFSDEFNALERHLHAVIPVVQPGEGGRDAVAEFFQQARQPSTGGRHWSRVVTLYRPPGRRLGVGAAPYSRLGSGVDSVEVRLVQPMPGFVMLVSTFYFDQDGQNIAADVFASHHEHPVERVRGGERYFMVEEAKARDLGRRLRGMIEVGIFPARAGFLGSDRYPAGAIAFWLAPSRVPPLADPRWRDRSDIDRALGLQIVPRWSGSQGTLIQGCPTESRVRGEGLSWIVGRDEISAADWRGYLSAEYYLISHHTQLLLGYQPWVLAGAAVTRLAQEAAELRRDIEGYAYTRFPHRHRRSLAQLVDAMDRCRYELRHIDVLAQGSRHARFPYLRMEDPAAGRTSADPTNASRSAESGLMSWLRTKVSLWKRTSAVDASLRRGGDDVDHFRRSITGWVDRLLQAATTDVDLCLERANHVLQLRTQASIHLWTIVTAFVALLTLLVALLALQNSPLHVSALPRVRFAPGGFPPFTP